MSKNGARIREAIKAIAQQPYEIRSGTVVPGSVNTLTYTVTVQPSDGGKPIEGVLLNSTRDNGNGVIVMPRDNSDVVIATIDGPGEWVLLRTGTIDKVQVKIGNVSCMADNSKITIQNGSVFLDVGTSTFKMNTASESLHDILKELLEAIQIMKYDSLGGFPLNATTFANLSLRIESLLST